MLYPQLIEIQRLANWSDENFETLKQKGLNEVQMARYFLSTSQTDVPPLTSETVERYLTTLNTRN
ncbi:MAG: hypothetical protein AAB657_00685 [Patescibacteria group bacterium]